MYLQIFSLLQLFSVAKILLSFTNYFLDSDPLLLGFPDPVLFNSIEYRIVLPN